MIFLTSQAPQLCDGQGCGRKECWTSRQVGDQTSMFYGDAKNL